MSNPTPNFLPHDPETDPEVDPGTVEVDGERELDPTIDADQVDSAAADRLAAGADDDVAVEEADGDSSGTTPLPPVQ